MHKVSVRFAEQISVLAYFANPTDLRRQTTKLNRDQIN